MSLLLCACAPKATVTSGSGQSIDEFRFEPYDGPRARIAVARFDDKTAAGQRWWSPEIGDGMADMMASALMSSNKFIVLERGIMDAIQQEQNLAGVAQGASIEKGHLEAAELLVVGAVTEFEPGKSGAGGGVAGGGGGLFGAFLGGMDKAHVAIDVRVVDTRTSRILASTTVEAEATDFALGGAVLDAFGVGALGVLGGYSKTPVEKAVRVAIVEAVKYVGDRTPAEYFHYPAGSRTSDSKAPATGYVTPAQLNVRTGPGTNWPATMQVPVGTAVTILEASGDWLRIRTANGAEGWVSARYIARSPD